MRKFRRLRKSPIIRDLVKENQLSLNDLIYPLFVVDKKSAKIEIKSMPGVYQLGFDELLAECNECLKLGIKSILLFGVLDESAKDSCGSDAMSDNGLIARAIRAIKERFGDSLYLIADLCFCEYTDHGHCGVLDEDGYLNNEITLLNSSKQALVMARAGVDMIAPSGMMDGIIKTLRTTLDENGFDTLPIMAYSTKFASAYYGPFRDVANSAPKKGDRKAYQMDYANGKEALNESLEDEKQGADILMVKPALAYLDVVKEISQNSLLPLCVYNVSGEYSMLKNAGIAGLVDYPKILMETMISFKRAGAKLIITYHAKELAEMLRG
ncbi:MULTISPECIES: porphobilinogen synthase [unclassified Campylobacter]|uniref:porphobilinogen synthase n=1 Tax=unclassified Campylobacter TaxID=2593542 RepID=UPI001BD9274B|nr:porphobilinogen synthase [Campylobacter sp. 2018MI27]MBT0884817.1 porphobilinogen synthase [Campylobacter sp. 2018MI10]MBZ7991908.1 porphobilinogen synthase [Campylobacter sp. RM9331]MBZ7993666.1 porphobilinogen synthase [Campylobacter sp. RM9333]MBZ8006147.1 porphobilinogen synthase [Campylobacter sp. RM9332]